MKIKWYICTLIISLSLLVVIQKQQSVIPNQEIVLQFQNETISVSETKTILDNLKQKLQEIGITSVAIAESNQGIFRILYYSEHDVNSIKERLQQEHLFVFQDKDSNLPQNKDSKRINFEVFEINKVTDSNWNFDGQLVYQLNLKSDRSFQLDDDMSSNLLSELYLTGLFKLQFKSNTNNAFILGRTSYNCPEVRAGPLV